MKNKLNYKLAKRGSKFFIKNIEEKTILAIFAKVKLGEALTLGDKLVLEAFNRYSSSLSDLNTLKNYLSGLSEEQLMGVTSNVKGILHEIQFAAIENNNFDSVYASLYETTNHPGYDVRMFDESTGEEWDIQLKATDNSAYVEDWIEEHHQSHLRQQLDKLQIAVIKTKSKADLIKAYVDARDELALYYDHETDSYPYDNPKFMKAPEEVRNYD